MHQAVVVYTTFEVYIRLKNIQICLKAPISLTFNDLVVRFWVYNLNIGCSNLPRASYCNTIYNKFFKLCSVQDIFNFSVIIRNYFCLENLFFFSDNCGFFSQGCTR